MFQNAVSVIGHLKLFFFSADMGAKYLLEKGYGEEGLRSLKVMEDLY